MENFGSLLKEVRERLKISQEKLAAALRVSFPTVNRWEKGKARPDNLALHNIDEFIKGLGVEYSDLYQRFSGMSPQSAILKSGSKDGKGLLDVKSMEGMLWKAACSIRGEKDAPKFKDYILPLIFIKRLSDVFEDEIKRLSTLYKSAEKARDMVDMDHGLVRFFVPPEAMWPVVSGRQKFEWPYGQQPKTTGEQLTNTVRAITKANPTLQGVIDIVDFNETRNGEREISDDALSRVIEILSDPRYRLGLNDVEPDFLGRSYEYLLRKFAESQGQSAGEFFTPKEVGWLMAYLVSPKQGEEVYDPCCGSGGLLIKCQLALREKEKRVSRPLRLFGQELMGSSFAIARMNMIVHDMEGEIVRGNSMINPKYTDGGRLRKFDVVVTNPMWNQDNFEPAQYETDPFERFSSRGGYAPRSSADWAWFQHIQASLKDGGRAAVVVDTGAASRGSGGQGDNKEKTIRKWFVDQDLIEGVILLPDNLFYNTTAAGLIIVLNAVKPKERKGKIILVNAGTEFEKGRPKNFITEKAIHKIADAYLAGKDVDRLVKVVTKEEIAKKGDYNLSPSRYVETATAVSHRDTQSILNELGSLREEASRLDGDLKKIFSGMGYEWK